MSIFSNTEEINSEILRRLAAKNLSKRKLAIVSGHYMLLYNNSSKRLEPVIEEDLIEGRHKEFAKLYAGGFPLYSFKSSINIFNEATELGVESNFVFIVNDHKFQSRNFQPNILNEIKGKTGKLRREYYQANAIPPAYLEALTDNELNAGVIQTYHVQDKQKQENILKDGYFFSEQRLRNKFEKHLKPMLIVEEKVRKVESSSAVELYYNNIPNSDICLTENGGCGCSGEVMEFIWELGQLGYTDVCFYVPNECMVAANNGFNVVTDIMKSPMTIYSMEGYGGMGINKKESIELTLNTFSNEN